MKEGAQDRSSETTAGPAAEDETDAVRMEHMAEMEKQYTELAALERENGKMRRMLEYRKDSLYYLWELYEGAGTERAKQIMGYMDPLVTQIEALREEIYGKLTEAEEKKNALEKKLTRIGGTLEEEACEPFFQPGDPALMLSGEGMNRTYAFGEDGRFEEDGTLLCLTGPLTADLPEKEILDFFADPYSADSQAQVSGTDLWEECKPYIVSAVLLDEKNLLQGISPVICEKVSPVAYNGNPTEQITLLMQWESVFYPDYSDAVPAKSVFRYGDTDYLYQGSRSRHGVHSEGVTVLTPHGVYRLQEQLEKYLSEHSDDPEMTALAGRVRDLAAVSQSLGGFLIDLCGLCHAFQYPVTIDPKDAYSMKIADCISKGNFMNRRRSGWRCWIRHRFFRSGRDISVCQSLPWYPPTESRGGCWMTSLLFGEKDIFLRICSRCRTDCVFCRWRLLLQPDCRWIL